MKSTINWFPGHMAKASGKILESASQVDLILEVVDARAIDTTSNIAFEKLNKPLLKVALKSDLADTKSIKQNNNVIIGSTKNIGFKQQLLNAINKVLEPYIVKKMAKGIKNPTIILMVVGLPNVGKSSLINFLAGRKQAQVGNMPAVTKSQAMIKIANNLYLQDNPGIFFKKVEDEKEGFTLSLVNTVRKEVLPLKEVNEFAFNYLMKFYKQEFNKFFPLDKEVNYSEFIKLYAKKRNFLSINNELDIVRAEEALFDDLVNGRVCKINYEKN